MGRFGGLSGVRTNQGGLFFLEGDYDVTLQEVKMIVNRKKQDCFIISARVDSSTNPDRAPGCKPSQVLVLREDILDTIMGNIKAFAAAVMEIDDPDEYMEEPRDGETQEEANERFWDETLEAMVADDQPCKGIRIHLNCTTIQTKQKSDFTKHVWGPVLPDKE